jgi:hypothetical protein
MSMGPDKKGQGIIEFILVFILVVLVIWILWTLLGPAITKWIGEFLSGI